MLSLDLKRHIATIYIKGPIISGSQLIMSEGIENHIDILGL